MTDSLKKTLNGICQNLGPIKDTKDYCAICEHILQVSQSLGYSFAYFDSEIFCFTGTHWEELIKTELKPFLSYCNCAVNQDFIKGKEYTAVEKLCKQFPFSILTMNTSQATDKINFRNGTLDLATNQLNPHNWQDYFRYILPFDYDPSAKCPRFLSYLERVMPDEDAQKVLAEYVGWIFVSDLKLEKVLFLYGAGCNGKSVFIDIMEALLGEENVSHESISDMCHGERGTNHRANIVGKLLNTCSDVAPNAFAGDVFKRMASGEPISVKKLYEDVTTTTSYPRMIFCLNELPKTNDLSGGYFRRFIIATFDVQIPKHEIDPKLASKIIETELPGIMNWALEGRNRLVAQEGFTPCALFDKANEDYKVEAKGKSKSLILLPPFC